MKLHLTQGLLAALIVAVAPVLAEGTALNINDSGNALTDGPGDYNASEMTWDSTASKASDMGKIYFGYNADRKDSGEYGVIVDATKEATVQALYFANTSSTFTKKGDGTLIIGTNNTGDSGCGLAASFDVAAGTLVLSGENYTPLTANVTTVGAGATLQLDAAQTLGNEGTASREHKIVLQNGGTLSGSGSVQLKDAAIAAEGKGNVVSTTVKSGWDINFEVADGGDLTLAGSLVKDGSDKARKFGAGTLIIGETATIDSALGLYLDEGTLDLSNVSSLDASSLTLAAGTTVILGENGLNMTYDSASLTVAEGVIFDLSAWNTSVEDFYLEELFSSVENFNSEGVKVYIDFGDGTLWDHWLLTSASDATLKVGSVYAIPEPATTTLSLLALAGLAARRRRK